MEQTHRLGLAILPTQQAAPLRYAPWRWSLGLLCVASSLWAAAPVHAQSVYRSVGADGRVSFSDRPDPANLVEPQARPTRNTTSAEGPRIDTAQLPYALRQTSARYPVTLYTTTECTPCDAARRMLVQRGIPYAERTVASDADLQSLQQLSGQQQLPFATVGQQHLQGWDESEWQRYLDLAGYPGSSNLPSTWQPGAATPLTASAPANAADKANVPTPPRAAAAPAPTTPAAVASPTTRGATPSNPTGITF